MSRDSQDGLKWEETLFAKVPRWTREPSIKAIESVCRQQLGICAGDPCNVSFYAAGAFNKLFLVTCADQSLLMRVSLPVYPRLKARAEVATLGWVRHETKIPVPKVVAFADNNCDEIEFEWILMEPMPGVPAHQRWRKMSMKQKVAFTRRVADFQAELCSRGNPVSVFRNIGTLDLDTRSGNIHIPTAVAPGQLVSLEFFVGDHLHNDVPRGPFRSSYDWLSSQLKKNLLQQEAVFYNPQNDYAREEAEEILGPARRLLSLLPKVFSATEEQPEVTALFHDDLNLHNILVDEDGDITAVVDWESALPIWMATRMPKFLDNKSREEEPKRDRYMDDPSDGTESVEKDSGTDKLDNEGKCSLYWIHRMEYEATQLRKVYKAKLKQLWPDWPLEESCVNADFFDAILECSAGVFVKQLNRWIDSLENGIFIRWADT